MIRHVLLASAAFGLAATPVAAQPDCIDSATSRAVADLVLPPLMAAVADKCGGEFAAYAPTVARNRSSLAGRFRSNADVAWPIVRDWVANSRDPKLDQARREIGKSEAFARAFVTTLLSQEVAKKLDARTCTATDTVLEAVLPLSDGQIGAIGAALIRLALLDPRMMAVGLRPCSSSAPR